MLGDTFELPSLQPQLPIIKDDLCCNEQPRPTARKPERAGGADATNIRLLVLVNALLK